MKETFQNPIVMVAVIGFFQAVTLTLLGWLINKLNRVKKDTAATKDQIVNHHETSPNFREENDARHDETKRWFRTLFKKMGVMERTVNERIDNVDSTVGELVTGFLENRERIEDIEKTQGGPKK